MKKTFAILLAFAGSVMTLSAQPGGGGGFRRTPEERVANVHAKLDSAFKLPAATFTVLDSALKVLYVAQDAKRQELFANAGGQRPNMDTLRAQMKPFTDAQDEILKAVLTAEQYTTWKEKIEPSMRPPRPMGGGGPPPGGGGNQ